MQLPLDILSHVTTRTGSGVEFGQQSLSSRASPKSHENSYFAKVVSRAQEALEKNKESDETFAAGVIENSHTVVSVLEGDKESATAPQTQIDQSPIIDAEHKSEIVEENVTPPSIDKKASQAEIMKITEAIPAQDNEVLRAADAPDDKNPEDLVAKAQSEAHKQTGEVMARMPSTGLSEQKSGFETIYKSSHHGNLSPLENENDIASVKGQHKQSFSDMTDSKSRDKDSAAAQPSHIAHVFLSDEGIRSERLRAEQQLKATALDILVKPENLFDEMVQRIEVLKTGSQRAMTIRLNPVYLGEVAIELIANAAGMHVKISAANTDVRAMINAQITALIESLEHKGIEIVEVEVTHAGIDIGAHNRGPNGEHTQQSGSSKYGRYGRGIRSERMDFFAGLKIDVAKYYLDLGVSSVEFSA